MSATKDAIGATLQLNNQTAEIRISKLSIHILALV